MPRVPPIHPECPQAGYPLSTGAVQEGHQALPIVDIGRRHHHGHDQPERVHQQMALAPFDLFVPVEPHLLALGGRLTLWLSIAPADG